MLEATNQPQAFYTKSPTDTPVGAGFGTTSAQPTQATPVGSPPMAPAPKKKSNKKLLAILVLALFAVVASVGVFISLRQQQVSGPQAPSAPTSRPAASEFKSQTCTIEWEVGPAASPIPSPSPKPTPSPSPSPSISPSPSPSPSPTPTVYQCGSTCTTDAQCETINGDHYCHPTLKVCRLESNPTNTECKPAASPTPSPSPSPSPVTYACNSSCSTDAQCQTANSSYVCDATAGNKCRLDTNRTNTSCQPAVATYPCGASCTTDTQCQSYDGDHVCYSGTCRLSSNPTASNCQPVAKTPPPVAVGCNEVCSTNSDCSNSDHICYTTADGTNRCRLANYVNSDTCTAPQVAYNPPAPQPELPAELPKTGAEDVMNWIKAGLVTLGIGAALLLLL